MPKPNASSASLSLRDLERYQRKGPDATSRLLLNALRSRVDAGASLLDIGGGVGVLDFELLATAAGTATLVDASPAYLDAATREAESRRVADRLRCVVGDFAVLAEGIDSADVVTMHRVVNVGGRKTSAIERGVRYQRF